MRTLHMNPRVRFKIDVLHMIPTCQTLSASLSSKNAPSSQNKDMRAWVMQPHILQAQNAHVATCHNKIVRHMMSRVKTQGNKNNMLPLASKNSCTTFNTFSWFLTDWNLLGLHNEFPTSLGMLQPEFLRWFSTAIPDSLEDKTRRSQWHNAAVGFFSPMCRLGRIFATSQHLTQWIKHLQSTHWLPTQPWQLGFHGNKHAEEVISVTSTVTAVISPYKNKRIKCGVQRIIWRPIGSYSLVTALML